MKIVKKNTYNKGGKMKKTRKKKDLPRFVKEPHQRPIGPIDDVNPHKPNTPESEKFIKDFNQQYYDGRREYEKRQKAKKKAINK